MQSQGRRFKPNPRVLLKAALARADSCSMRKMLVVTLLMGVFLGGYYVGQIPQSPNLATVHQTVYRWVSERLRPPEAKAGEKPEPAVTNVVHKVYKQVNEK